MNLVERCNNNMMAAEARKLLISGGAEEGTVYHFLATKYKIQVIVASDAFVEYLYSNDDYKMENFDSFLQVSANIDGKDYEVDIIPETMFQAQKKLMDQVTPLLMAYKKTVAKYESINENFEYSKEADLCELWSIGNSVATGGIGWGKYSTICREIEKDEAIEEIPPGVETILV